MPVAWTIQLQVCASARPKPRQFHFQRRGALFRRDPQAVGRVHQLFDVRHEFGDQRQPPGCGRSNVPSEFGGVVPLLRKNGTRDDEPMRLRQSLDRPPRYGSYGRRARPPARARSYRRRRRSADGRRHAVRRWDGGSSGVHRIGAHPDTFVRHSQPAKLVGDGPTDGDRQGGGTRQQPRQQPSLRRVLDVVVGGLSSGENLAHVGTE